MIIVENRSEMSNLFVSSVHWTKFWQKYFRLCYRIC